MHLELVNNTIRTKLDEIKRMEVQRLQELARIKMRSMSGTEVLHFIAAHGGKLLFLSCRLLPLPAPLLCALALCLVCTAVSLPHSQRFRAGCRPN